MNWDWYAATLPAPVEEVVGELVRGNDLASFREMSPKNGYERAGQVVRGDRVLATVLWGGNGNDPHAFASGRNAPEFAGLIRGSWPDHRVTRVDAAEDYRDTDAWEVLSGLVLRVADAHKLKVLHVGDYHRGEDGRTLYLGSKSSVCRVRLYEKGLQEGTDPAWVRVEAQIRPKGPGRRVLAKSTPSEAWGAARWMSDLAEQLGVPELEQIKAGTVWRSADDARAYKAMLRQYGPLLGRRAEQAGGWCALGVQLGCDLDKLLSGNDSLVATLEAAE